jgi:hypothetical protein
MRHWSLTTLRDRLIKIGGKMVRHGRYVTFQMVGVAIPRELFADILPALSGSGQSRLPHDGPNVNQQ